MSEDYTTIIGLEVHVQLSTASKLFCGCSTRFGAEPNTQTCQVCIGMPGTLPVMNREAFRLALRTAVALNCEIPARTKWDRKQYYYPDLPKNYQISQYDLPMSQHGFLEISDTKGRFEPKRIRILRAHLEEDAGKSLHDEVAGKADSLIDLNRTGTPLLEIVSEPDMRSSAEAKEFLTELKLLLVYIGVSDCNMQEGSLRVDANVNLHIATPQGLIATPIVEIKNMNSFRAVERALDYEAERQFGVWRETGQKLGDAPKQTRGWDDAAGVTRGQRSKEESSDYRYFPDPDLAPVTVTAKDLDEAHASLPELPAQLRKNLETKFKLPPYDASVIVEAGRPTVDFYLETTGTNASSWTPNVNPKTAANTVTQFVFGHLAGKPIQNFPISSGTLNSTISFLEHGAIPPPRYTEFLEHLYQTGSNEPKDALEKFGFQTVSESELTALCQDIIAANAKIVSDIRSGKIQAVGALVGQAKKRNPNIDPGQFREMCLQLIQAKSS